METRREVVLHGCSPKPLAGYLRALGVLRLVATQADPGAEGWWEDESFHLLSTLDAEGLTDFLCNDYQPTPIIAPWNGGSGFYPKDNRDAPIAILGSPSARFSAYRLTLETAMQEVRNLGLENKPTDETKLLLLQRCRNTLPDVAVEWLDAAVVLTTDGPKFPPLLGTGGNDGRLEFTNNFMQRLLDVINPQSGEPMDKSPKWLQAALFGGIPSLQKAAVGQFSPGGAGGPNARAGFEGESLVNPWEFIFTLEGALTLTAAASKRLESANGAALSYPFTVRAAAVGYGGVSPSDEDTARAEMWMPLWDTPATYDELTHIFREGRAHVNGRPARDGVDFARACAALAVDRGISSFERYAFLQRSGRSYLAVPLGRFRVYREPAADILGDLEKTGLLDRLASYAKGEGGKAFASAYRNIREAMLALCVHEGSSTYRTQQLLIAVGKVEQLLASRPKAREALPRPLVLKDSGWLYQADDGSDEFMLAAGIVGLYTSQLPHIRAYFSPVIPNDPSKWDVATSPRVVWNSSDLTRNLVGLVRRRLLDMSFGPRFSDGNVSRRGKVPGDLQDAGLDTGDVETKPLSGWFKVPLKSVLAYLNGQVNETKVMNLIWGLLPLTTRSVFQKWALAQTKGATDSNGMDSAYYPWVYAASKLVAAPDRDLRTLLQEDDSFSVPLPRQLLSTLASRDRQAVHRASEMAERRLVASGISGIGRGIQSPGISGIRCAGALAFPLSYRDLRNLLDWVRVDSSSTSKFEGVK